MADEPTGIELARRYFAEVVAPLLLRRRPDLRYAAGRLGSGSDVLGLDDDRSRDHDWGLRLTLLVADDDTADQVRDLLEAELPPAFAGHPTRFSTSWDPDVTHEVETAGVTAFVESRLGLDPARLDEPTTWLGLTGQAVLEVVAGPVFADTDGSLTAVRERLRWYPDDVWRYVVAAGWQRLAQELPMVGRCADTGDDLGSRLITARLVRDLMHLGFLVERTWASYPKWFGTRFARLPVASAVLPHLGEALTASDWRARESALASAATAVHLRQGQAGLPTVPEPIVPLFARPYRTVDADLIAALSRSIDDTAVARLPIGIGSIEQWVDNVDVLIHPRRRTAAAAAFLAALHTEP